MSLLDRTGGGQGSSHLDDLDGLLGVADLHPDPGGFEPWLRPAFQRETDPAGVTLSTVHRVKGREWDRVAVFGVADGIVPHRLAEDVEEERRVLHVAITRGRHRVAVLADRTRPQPVPRRARRHGAAPAGATGAARRRPTPATRRRRRSGPTARRRRPTASRPRAGLASRVPGRLRRHRSRTPTAARVDRAPRHAAPRCASASASASSTTGARRRSLAPTTLWGAAAEAEAALRAWRIGALAADGVPAYIVVNDKHLRGIALARPSTPAELVACDGIGPAKLERYGDEILEVLEPFAT